MLFRNMKIISELAQSQIDLFWSHDINPVTSKMYVECLGAKIVPF